MGDHDKRARELLPCPWCGPGESVVSLWFDDGARRYRVGCGRCGCSTGIHPRDQTEAPAIASWNTRALTLREAQDGFVLVPVDPTPDMVEAAEEAYMPFGDMELAIQMAIAASPRAGKEARANSAVSAIRFALSDPEGMTFLRLWSEGEFDTLRREWPDAPVEVYIGADPLAAQQQGGRGAVVE